MNLIQRSKENITAAARNNLLTPCEVATMLGTTQGVLAVWRTTKRYPLRYIKVGRLVRYRPEDIQSFLDSRTVSPAAV